MREGIKGYAITCVVRAAHERDAALALHRRRDRVSEKLGLWPELTDDGDFVRRRNVVEGGYGWMV